MHPSVNHGWDWNHGLPTKQLVLPTLCVQALAATGLGVSFWKRVVCQSTGKPQGNESLAPRAMQDWAAPDPNPPLHCSANTSLTTSTTRSCKHCMVCCGPGHAMQVGHPAAQKWQWEHHGFSLSAWSTHWPPSPFYRLRRTQGAQRFACTPL